jgi:hypothetical protein
LPWNARDDLRDAPQDAVSGGRLATEIAGGWA